MLYDIRLLRGVVAFFVAVISILFVLHTAVFLGIVNLMKKWWLPFHMLEKVKSLNLVKTPRRRIAKASLKRIMHGFDYFRINKVSRKHVDVGVFYQYFSQMSKGVITQEVLDQMEAGCFCHFCGWKQTTRSVDYGCWRQLYPVMASSLVPGPRCIGHGRFWLIGFD